MSEDEKTELFNWLDNVRKQCPWFYQPCESQPAVCSERVDASVVIKGKQYACWHRVFYGACEYENCLKRKPKEDRT